MALGAAVLAPLWALATAALAAAPSPAALFPAPPPEERVFAPMQAEMDRSMKRLKLEDFGPPYFLAYRLVDEESLVWVASFGGLTRTERESSRTLYVEARYGDPSFDNTELRYHGWSSGASLDAGVLRQQLWQLTDGAYKGAVAGFLDRKAKRATELDRDNLPDFSREEPRRDSVPSPGADEGAEAKRRELVEATAEFRRHPFVYGSNGYLVVRRARRYLLTSEGTRVASPAEHAPATMALTAWTRADDGMMLESRRSWVARAPKDLPDLKTLRRQARELALELKSLREAPLQDPFSAPAILDPEFTGVLFHEALGHKLEGQAQRDPGASQIFKDRVGTRVIPEFLSVVDDPTMAEFRGSALHGHYRYDDEGIPAQRVALVERGILKGFLLSRWPVKGFERSNGHGRADKGRHPSGRMANLMVAAHEPVSARELKERLLKLCLGQGKPYGFWLKGSGGGENPSNRASAQTLEVRARLVYRVDAATGEERLVRGVKMVGTPLVLLNRIVAAGDDLTLANPFNCGAESGTVPVDQIAPSVLVSELELQRLPEERARPPLLPSPYHDAP